MKPFSPADLLTRAEDQWFERKSFKIQPKDLAKTIVAMANADGGTIAVGITDRSYDGHPSTKQENSIRQTPLEHTDPTVQCSIEVHELPDGFVLLLNVQPGSRVHYLRSGECYLRVGDQSHRLNADDILELRYSKGEQLFDATPARDSTLEDLDPEKLADFAERIGSRSSIDALRARNLLTRDHIPTVAALLLFGTNPQRDFPSAYVRVLKWNEADRLPGREQQLLEDHRFEGTIPDQITAAREKILELIPRVRRLGSEGSFVDESLIPPNAWLEGLVNAAIHRSYSLMGDHIRFEIFPDRIAISSPGRFPGLADPRDPERITRFARNPHIARIASELRIGQELGEGIRRIFSEMRQVGFQDPVYRQTSGSVILQLRAEKRLSPRMLSSLPSRAEQILSTLQLSATPLSTGQVADAAGVSTPSARRALRALRDADLVIWRGSSARDPRATWAISDHF
ncbi:MAG: ATP-binding protein [Corynebacterium sp.]|uniref:RNA-binding domain-containing protein n=1 Tax=Corynebacterium sp. TaxID=1720 RepID=UPI0026E061CA|nr:RNA-binding domain-containing protein [Corynebacterium sp.]MDO5670954.1 ATP-binding protein [Corynebacterium sp.]